MARIIDRRFIGQISGGGGAATPSYRFDSNRAGFEFCGLGDGFVA